MVSWKCSNVIEEYQKEMANLSHRLVSMVMGSLGLTHKELRWLVPNITGSRTDSSQSFLQLNSYPVCPDPDLAMGLAPHTDSSLLTILYQGNIPGQWLYIGDYQISVVVVFIECLLSRRSGTHIFLILTKL